MKFAYFFIDRPVFAAVLSIVTVIVGAISIFALPIAQYPDIAPPTVTVSCDYPARMRRRLRRPWRRRSRSRSTASKA